MKGSTGVEHSKKPYVIGSGWFCDGTGKHAGSIQPHMQSADDCRRRDFHHVWYHFINKYTNPAKILIVDSNSPVKPPINRNDERIEYLDLDRNFGHAVSADKNLSMSGWERAVIMGAMYALLNEMDFVYVEQDCLVVGSNWVDYCRNRMNKKKIMFGSGAGTFQRIQQSLFLVDVEYIPEFLNVSINPKTGGVQRVFNRNRLKHENPESRWYRYFSKHADYLPFGSGRARPIPTNDDYFYVQHLTNPELKEIQDLDRLDNSESGVSEEP